MLNGSLTQSQTLNQNNKLEIIWIDKNIGNQENQQYLGDLKSSGSKSINNVKTNALNNGLHMNREPLNKKKYDIQEFIEIDKAIEYIKTIRFVETIIIVSGSYLSEFMKQFKANIRHIYIIPRIVVFTNPTRTFSEDILREKFYSGAIKRSFQELKATINNYQMNHEEIKNNRDILVNKQYAQQSIFVELKTKDDLKLPQYYEKLVEILETKDNPYFISKMFNIYKNDPKYNSLLNQMIYISDIPIELLIKYYARLYTIDGDFYKKMNSELTIETYDNIIYQPYIKTLYEGSEKKFFNNCEGMELYSSQTFSDNEINEIYDYKNNFLKDTNELKKDLPMPIIFSKIFLSFNKDINEAEKYIRYGKNVMLILKLNDNKYNLKTHADIEEFSFYPNEKEVLFFPFSAFGIKNFEFIPYKKLYNIELIYYGKFNKEFDVSQNIDSIDFVKFIMKTGLVKQIPDITLSGPKYGQKPNPSRCGDKSCCFIL